MPASDEASEYEKQWPALFVEWGDAKVKEWRDRLDHERARLTAAQVQKLEYDISCLGHAIERIRAASGA
jgi:DNA-binding IclR family transcriptional regulator